MQGAQYQYSSEKSKLRPQFTVTRMAHTLLLRMKKWYSHFGILPWQLLIKLNTVLWASTSNPMYMPWRYEWLCQKKTYTAKFIAALLIICQKLKTTE